MSKNKNFQYYMLYLIIILLCFSGSIFAQVRQNNQGTLEDYGRTDPFAYVAPILETKRPNVQRLNDALNEEAAQAVQQTPDLFVETIVMKFLQAASIQPVLSRLISPFGAVSVDTNTNSIIVCDDRENLDKIVAEIKKIDAAPRQILIEVVIIDVQLNDETEIGVDWTHLFGDNDSINTFESLWGGSTTDYTGNIHDKTFNQTLISTLLEAGGGFSLVGNSIMVTIKALQQVRNVEILASPRVLVVSGQSAELETIEEIAYTELTQSTGGGGTTDAVTSTEFKEVGISLKVKAVITDQDKILMTIEPEQSVNTGVNNVTNSTVPVVDKRKAKTTLLMNDGQVAVMGGLRKRETRISEDKIPLLGDLPIVGFLFSSENTDIKHSELLVFISPHIYKDEPLSEEHMKRYREILEGPPLTLPKENINNPVKAVEQAFSGKAK